MRKCFLSIIFLLLYFGCKESENKNEVNMLLIENKQDSIETILNKNELKLKLYRYLMNICDSLKIKYEYSDTLTKCIGRLYYSRYNTGEYDLKDSKIHIFKTLKNPMFVLAHELGHYFGIKDYNDKSEKTADYIGNLLCCHFLNKSEQKILEKDLKNYLQDE